MSNLKRFFASLTVASTILMTGAGAILPVTAVTIADGDLVKSADSSAVYLIQGAKKRVIPHLNVYLSWGYPSNFSTVKTVSAADLALYADDNAVPFRDGAMFRGTAQSLGGKEASAVFYVEDAQLRAIKSAEIYQALFNDANWTKVTWVPDDLLTKFNYPMGTNIESSATHPDGCLIKYTGTTQVYLIQDGKKRAVSAAAMTANQLNAANVITIAATETYTDGTAITGAESAILTPGWATTVGALTIALDADSPADGNVPVSAVNIPHAKIKLTASGPVTINSLTVKRTGLGAAADFANIGIFEGNTQVGTYKTLSATTDSTTFNFTPAISMTANQVKYLSVKATPNAGTAGHANKLGITALTTNGTVTGLPVYGNIQTIVDINIGAFQQATIGDSNGALTGKVGEDDVYITKVKLTLNNVEDADLVSLKLRQYGTAAADDFSGLVLKKAGAKVADCTYDVSDYLTCVLSTPLKLNKGALTELALYGNIDGGVTRTIRLGQEEMPDVNAIGRSYGFSLGILNQTNNIDTLTIGTGAVSLNINGPVTGDISQTQQNINLANIEITVNGENAELRTFRVMTTVGGAGVANATTNAALMENVELYDPATGDVIDGRAVLVSIGGAEQNVPEWEFLPGVVLEKDVKKTYQLRIDTPTDAPGNLTTFQVLVKPAHLFNCIKGATSNQYVAVGDISPQVQGSVMTVKAPALSLTQTALSAGKAVAGEQGVLLYKGKLEAQGKAIKVTTITIDEVGDNGLADANIDQLYLYTVSGATETLVRKLEDSKFADNTATFDNLGDGLVIEAGSSNAVTFVVRADLASPLGDATKDSQIKIADVNKVAAQTEDLGTQVLLTNSTYGDGCLVDVKASGTLTLDIDNLEAGLSRDSYVIAGATTPFIGRISLLAQDEDVLVRKLILENKLDAINDTVDKFELYKADKTTKVAEAAMSSATTSTFDPLNYTVTANQEDFLYIKAVLKKSGIGSDETAGLGDAIILKINDGTTASGVKSNIDLTAGAGTLTIDATETKEYKVTATKINAVANTLPDGNLVAGPAKILAKFKVTNLVTTNTTGVGAIAKTILKNLKVTATLNNATATPGTVKIYREGGVDAEAAYVLDANNNLTELLANDSKIASGVEATFVIKGTVDITDPAGAAYLQLQVDTAGADFGWNDNTNDINGLRLYDTAVLGAYLSYKP